MSERRLPTKREVLYRWMVAPSEWQSYAKFEPTEDGCENFIELNTKS